MCRASAWQRHERGPLRLDRRDVDADAHARIGLGDDGAGIGLAGIDHNGGHTRDRRTERGADVTELDILGYLVAVPPAHGVVHVDGGTGRGAGVEARELDTWKAERAVH